MTYQPVHTLSECLTRRHTHLMEKVKTLVYDGSQVISDQIVSSWEEIYSLEYWLRIAHEAERENRMSAMIENIVHTTRAS